MMEVQLFLIFDKSEQITYLAFFKGPFHLWKEECVIYVEELWNNFWIWSFVDWEKPVNVFLGLCG